MQDDLNNQKSIKTNLNNLLISTGSPAFVEKNQGMRKNISSQREESTKSVWVDKC
jgi:hypothetical protein